MHAYLVVGYDQKKRDWEVENLVKKLGLKRFGFELKKIADTRELMKFVSLGLDAKSAVVIEDIDQASVDAQNAFLKSLEEPQENLTYIVTASSQDSVLPTIASRCQIVESQRGDSGVQEKILQSIENFLSLPEGKRLKEISKITKREDAVDFMKAFIKTLESKLKSNPDLVYKIELASETLKRINANGNVQLQLANFTISL